jgi:predicted enzyme related to lactoylglutathione lyase
MAHRSKLGAISIDVPAATSAAAAAFWSAALGRTTREGTHHDEFRVVEGGPFPEVMGLIQAVGDPAPRVHLDLHTDDVEAEVARLVELGATETARFDGWVVLADPGGLPFCVCGVPPDAQELDGAAAYGD